MSAQANPNYRVEHVATVPAGWKVRTKMSATHMLRIAFPPGARRKGSGKLIEIFHPANENPCAMQNPRTRNGSFRETLTAGTRSVIISKDAEGAYFHTYPYVNSGETAVKSLGSFRKLETARAKANKWLAGAGRNPFDWREQQQKSGDILDSIRHGSRVTIVDRFGKSHTGRAVMRGPAGWVLNMGGAHGTPGIATAANVTRVKNGNPWNPDIFAKHQIAIAKKTLRMSDEMARVLGGMTKEEARAVLQKHGVRMRESENPQNITVHFENSIRKFQATTYDQKFGNLFSVGDTEKEAKKALRMQIRDLRTGRRGHNPAKQFEHRKAATRKDLARFIRQHPKASRKGVLSQFPGHRRSNPEKSYAERVLELEMQGLTTSDAQAVVDAEDQREGEKGIRKLQRPKSGKRGNGTVRNPEGTDEAAGLYEKFHGKEPGEILEMQESDAARQTYTALGDLQELVIDAPSGKVKIGFDPSDRVKVASAPGGKQLYLLGGNQNLDSQLDRFGSDAGKDFVELGAAVQITYRARKSMDNFQMVDYYHDLGEETHEPPMAFYDRLKRRIFLAGGRYRVEAPGIIN